MQNEDDSIVDMSTRTLFTALEEAAEKYGDATALIQPEGGGKTTEYSWNQYRQTVKEIACGLRHLGIGHGDVVAIQSETRAEFYFADMGIIANGSTAAAMYTSYPQGEAIKKLRACGAKLAFIENPKMLASITAGLTREEPLEIRWVLMTRSCAQWVGKPWRRMRSFSRASTLTRSRRTRRSSI
jgi:long-chain acyl-CoA synthetase